MGVMKYPVLALWVALGGALLLSFYGGYALRPFIRAQILNLPQVISENPIRVQGQYALVSPLLACGAVTASSLEKFQPLQEAIEKSVTEAKETHKADVVAVYFRDLNTSSSIGVDQDLPFSPASLLKVPVLMSFLKKAENTPSLLGESLFLSTNPDRNVTEYFRQTGALKAGTYSISELLKAMIVASDNNATYALLNKLDIGDLSSIYTDLSMENPILQNATTSTLSPRQYSYFFRALYGASYLSSANSEKALEFLSESHFSQGLKGGVPSTVTVASKFGERTVFRAPGQPSDQELHDCGIIYYPAHPYFLCVMTKGTNLDTLSRVIKDVSAKTYEEVLKIYPPIN